MHAYIHTYIHISYIYIYTYIYIYRGGSIHYGGVPDGWFTMESPIKWMILGYPYFRNIYIHMYIYIYTCIDALLGFLVTSSQWITPCCPGPVKLLPTGAASKTVAQGISQSSKTLFTHHSLSIQAEIFLHMFQEISNRRKFRSQTSNNMQRWKSRGGKSQRGEVKKWEAKRWRKSEERRCRCAKR